MIIGRRSFLRGLLAAPLIVRAGSLMPGRAIYMGWDLADGPDRTVLNVITNPEIDPAVLAAIIARLSKANLLAIVERVKARADMEFFDGQRWVQGALTRVAESGIRASLGGFPKPLNGRDGAMSGAPGPTGQGPIPRLRGPGT